jgi:hypothetical protein
MKKFSDYVMACEAMNWKNKVDSLSPMMVSGLKILDKYRFSIDALNDKTDTIFSSYQNTKIPFQLSDDKISFELNLLGQIDPINYEDFIIGLKKFMDVVKSSS